jgi:hypothetical protein
MKKASFILLVALISGATSFAQLTGVKTIPGDYATVASAIAALNISGAGAGGVTFEIAPGHTETFSSPTAGRITSLTSSPANPVVFQKSSAGANPVITAAVGAGDMDGIVVICGGDNITFDGVNLSENPLNVEPTTQMEWGFAVLRASGVDGSQHVTIKNCTVTLDKTNLDSKGIYSNNHTALSLAPLGITAVTGTNSHLKIFNNTISDCNSCIYLSGYNHTVAPYAYYDQNCEIGVDGANTITDFGGASLQFADPETYGIYTKYQNNLKVANNNVTSTTIGGYKSLYGIYLTTANNASYELYGNTVSIYFAPDDIYGNAHFYPVNCDMGANGTSNVANIYNNTVTNCTFYNSASQAATRCFYFFNMGVTANVHGNVISNNTIGGDPSATAIGDVRYFWCQKASTEPGPLVVHDNSVTGNNRIQSVPGGGTTYMLAIAGSGTTLNAYNNLVDNNVVNTFGSTKCLQITFNDATSKNVYNNTVNNITKANGSTDGLYNANGTLGKFYNNIIRNISSNSSGTINITGINHSSGTAMYYYNNMICDLSNPRSEATLGYDYNVLSGIYIENNQGFKRFYNNTVYLNSSTSATTFGSSAICAFSLYGVELRNNILVNTSAPAGANGKTVGIRSRTAGVTGFTSNYNNIYAGSPGPSRMIFYNGTSGAETLSAYKTLFTPQELQTVTELPPFINVATQPWDVHLQSNVATQCEAGGTGVFTPQLSITTDFDGHARYPNAGYPVNPSFSPKAPDIGADEFGGLPNDITAPGIVYTPLPNTHLFTQRTLIATISDGTGVPTTGTGRPTLYWKKNAGAYTAVTGTFLSGNNYSFIFGGGVTTNDVVSYYIVAQDMAATPNVLSFPWVGASGFTINPPACSTPPATPTTYTIIPTISGVFHVGAGKTYTTLTAAVNDINSKGMTGPVTFILDDNNYTGETFPIVFNPNEGSSATNILTIKPNTGVTPLISGSVSSTGLLIFKGMDYVTIDGSNSGGTDKSLTFENTSSSTLAHIIGITNNGATDGSKYITLRNCNIVGNNSSIIVDTYLIYFNQDAGLYGGGYDNISIENNSIRRAKCALNISATAGRRNNNIIISGNIFGSGDPTDYITRWGIAVEQSDNTLITGNDIMGPADGSNAPSQFGVLYYNNCTNTKITKNRIHDWVSNTTGSYGIKCDNDNPSTPTEISNNLIYNIGAYGLNPGIAMSQAHGIVVRSGGNIRIWYNSIYMSGPYLYGIDSYAPSSSCIGLWGQSTDMFDIRNNILRNSMTNPAPNPDPSAMGKAYGIMTSWGPESYTALDNNDYYIDGHHGQVAQLYCQGGVCMEDFTTLASWQAFTGMEANSIDTDPLFVNISDLKLQSGSPAIGMATPIAEVTTDFEGTPRSATYPTIGAYEYAYTPPVNLVWTGLMNTSWNTAGNWTPVAVPTSVTEALIPSVPAGGLVFPVVPAAGGPFYVKKLQVEAGATVTLQSGSSLNIVDN